MATSATATARSSNDNIITWNSEVIHTFYGNWIGVKSNREIKRERNELTSQMISQLKQECARPEVVEVWDIRARDPKLLVYLKAYRNTVPVPRHWSQKRKYLQGKRGIEKAPFELPSFIQSTGTVRSSLYSNRFDYHGTLTMYICMP